MKNDTILLIDADSTIPNLALMKLSAYYKSKQFQVELIRCKISYYPNKKKFVRLILEKKYYKVFVSCVFDNTFQSLEIIDSYENEIIYGGTGIDYNIVLDPCVEKMLPDYSIYPDNDTSYGFITRGCVRKCKFCVVPHKEGNIRLETHPENIVRHKKVKFLDNNILAYDGHIEILRWLIDNKVKCQFNQGLDIRLLDEENAYLLGKIFYINQYIFAFDDIKYKKIIEEKLKLLKWRINWQIKFFVYVHPDMKLEDSLYRVLWLKEKKCLPYMMRDISCWDSEYELFYIDLAGWCNNPMFFKKCTFLEFLQYRYDDQERIDYSNELYEKTRKNIDI